MRRRLIIIWWLCSIYYHTRFWFLSNWFLFSVFLLSLVVDDEIKKESGDEENPLFKSRQLHNHQEKLLCNVMHLCNVTLNYRNWFKLSSFFLYDNYQINLSLILEIVINCAYRKSKWSLYISCNLTYTTFFIKNIYKYKYKCM